MVHQNAQPKRPTPPPAPGLRPTSPRTPRGIAKLCGPRAALDGTRHRKKGAAGDGTPRQLGNLAVDQTLAGQLGEDPPLTTLRRAFGRGRRKTKI
eukprot:9914718-Lingulodinium_polyedra.AAC.2